jgi:hypothetical protein
VEVILLKDPHGDHMEILLKGLWSVIQIDSIKNMILSKLFVNNLFVKIQTSLYQPFLSQPS